MEVKGEGRKGETQGTEEELAAAIRKLLGRRHTVLGSRQ